MAILHRDAVAIERDRGHPTLTFLAKGKRMTMATSFRSYGDQVAWQWASQFRMIE